jgi:hypothetical protein
LLIAHAARTNLATTSIRRAAARSVAPARDHRAGASERLSGRRTARAAVALDWVARCMAELTDLRTSDRSTRTIAIESEDPARVIAAVRELGLGSRLT